MAAAPTPIVVHHGGRRLAGVARPGEGWGAAAARIAATVAGEPSARDLSGEVKHFAVDPDAAVTLRALGHGDLPEVTRWRQQEHVARWWGSDGPATLESVTARYGPRVDGRSPTRMWLAEAHGRAVGLVQDYRLADYPEFARLTSDPSAVGVDYLVGDADQLGRGIGTRMLWSWLRRMPHRFPAAEACFAAPHRDNAASLRVLDKVGFVRGEPFEEPGGDGTTVPVLGCRLDVAVVLGWSP